MLCTCYGSGDEDLHQQIAVKSGWLSCRLSHSLAIERRRWFVLRYGERGATLSYYADDAARRLLGSLPLGNIELVGDVARSLRVCKRIRPCQVVRGVAFWSHGKGTSAGVDAPLRHPRSEAGVRSNVSVLPTGGVA